MPTPHRPRRSPSQATSLAPLGVATIAIALLTSAPWSGYTDARAGADTDAAILHVLNRLTFGPRPGDTDDVRASGIDAFIERQLHPARIDDGDMEQELRRFQTLELDTATLVREFHLPAERARRERRRERARETPTDDDGEQPGDGARPGEPGMSGAETRPRMRDLPDEIQRERVLYQELMEQKLIRAADSERQLQEVLVDFWFNHFNVSAEKSPMIRPFLTGYERDAIRPHVLGSFRDLLGAVAESPAMLIYLDNWLSSNPDGGGGLGAPGVRRPPNGPRPPFGFARPPWMGVAGRMTVQPGRRAGLNENYARELLELHTLGVDGGYTQDDVVDVARALTGWTFEPLERGGRFRFESRLHAGGDKTVLGELLDGDGKREGDAVLDRLSQHPATARFLASKLAARFVADDPPASLVDRAARVFLETDVILREVTRTIVTSDEFFDPETRASKVRTPLEFVVSSVRAIDADVGRALALVRSLRELGMPLYACQPPTGYSDRADAWVNTGALLARMNFAVTLVGNRLPGVAVDLREADRPNGAPVRDLFERLVVEPGSATTRKTLADTTSPEHFAILALGSPEFQRQ